MNHQPILVIGATGKTGRRVVERLATRDVAVRAGSRHPVGADAISFDWFDRSTWDAAITGVEAVYVIPPAFVVDHAALSAELFAVLAEHRAGRVVLLSARGVDVDDAIPMRQAELSLLSTDLDATIVRPTWFDQNFTEGVFAHDLTERDVVEVPAADGLEPFIDVDDIADVVVELLLDRSGEHTGAAYDLSGPSSITFGDAAAIIGAARGREVRFVDASPEEFAATLDGAGVPSDYVALLGGLFEVIRNGWDAHTSDGVEQILGRPATSFEHWARGAFSATP